MVLSILLILWSGTADIESRLELQPLDFQGDLVDHYIPTISQIESNGTHLFIRSSRHTSILVLDREGRMVETLGGRGEHPMEFGFSGVLAIAVNGKDLWGLDMGRARARHFHEGTYQNSFRLKSFNTLFTMPTSNVFAFSETQVVIPANARDQGLANVYSYNGDLLGTAGELLPFPEELTRNVIAMNDAFWLRNGGQWFSIHKFYPIVTTYDDNFQTINQYEIHTPYTSQRLDGIRNFQKTERVNVPNVVFTDAKFHKGDLYLMCMGRLHRIQTATGKVKSITAFYGTGPDFGEVAGKSIYINFFCFLDNGRLIIAHPQMMWNHDLWYVPWDKASEI